MTAILRKFFADRGTHLAAMIAYFALLSFVPLLLLSLALLGAADQADSGSFFVRELHRTFPSTSLDSILNAVQAIQRNATALGIVGGSFLLWSSLSLFSVLESAFNIVYDRPNRPFLRGKALATLMMVFSLLFLFSSLVVGTVGVDLLKRYTGLSGNVVISWLLTFGVSLLGAFIFLSSAYVVLTNADLHWHHVFPGAAVSAVLMEATFQFLPAFVRVSKHNPVLQTLSGPAVLLVWLYVMANVIVLGAEVNYWWGINPRALRPARALRGLGASFAASRRRLALRRFASRRPG
jgi:membrane protein